MIKIVHKHKHSINIIGLLIVGGLALFIGLNTNRMTQIITAWSVVGIYFLWGIIHHHIRRDLTGFIVLEYLMIALLAGVVLHTVISIR